MICDAKWFMSNKTKNMRSKSLNWSIYISCGGVRDLIWKDYWWLITLNRSKVLIDSYLLWACVEVIECRICFNSFFLPILYTFNFFLCSLEIRRPLNRVRQIEMNKKGKEIDKASSTEDLDMSPLFSDTTRNKDCDISSWEAMYQLFGD